MEIPFGKILTGNEGRDAFHQAIIPLIVDDTYWSGSDWVKKVEGSNTKVQKCGSKDKNCIGFIDPYIHDTITESGKKVYIFLNQGLINDMRHHFTSPFFNEEDIVTDTNTQSNISKERLEAKQWLQDVCKENRLDFEVFEKSDSIGGIYGEIHMYVKLNTCQGEGGLEESIMEIYKNFAIYKNIEFDENDEYNEDIYYIDWCCLNCD